MGWLIVVLFASLYPSTFENFVLFYRALASWLASIVGQSSKIPGFLKKPNLAVFLVLLGLGFIGFIVGFLDKHRQMLSDKYWTDELSKTMMQLFSYGAAAAA